MEKFSYTDDNGLWMRISKFSHPDQNKPDITLLPMIHIADRDYYKEMNQEAWCHDICYYEGCWLPGRGVVSFVFKTAAIRSGLRYQGSGGRSRHVPIKLKGRSVTNEFELDEYITELRCECGQCPKYSLRSIRADLHKPLSRLAIANIPLFHRVVFPFVLVISFVLALLFLSRAELSGLKLEDDDDDLKTDWFGRFMAPYWGFVRDDRDYFLQTVLHNEILAKRNRGLSLSVKYGERHMKPLADFLVNDLGYKRRKTRAVLAVKADKKKKVSDEITGYGEAHIAFISRYHEKTAGDRIREELIFESSNTAYDKDISAKDRDFEGSDIKKLSKVFAVGVDNLNTSKTWASAAAMKARYKVVPPSPVLTRAVTPYHDWMPLMEKQNIEGAETPKAVKAK